MSAPSNHQDLAPVITLAKQAIAQMTLPEKIAYLCAEHPAIERLDYPAYRLEAEGAHGLVIRNGQSFLTEDAQTTVFPETFGLSLTWDRQLLRRIGEVISDEARVFNTLVLFSPTIDLARDPRWGRNEEAYGEDPYLAGQLGAEYIKGLQGNQFPYLKTAATVKHFYANNYEFERDWDDSVISEQLKRDYYLRPFETAFVEAQAASAMTGYNMINGTIGMLNPELNTILRDEWGANGYFVSDGKAPEILGEMYGLIGDGDEVESLARYLAKALNAGLDCFLAYDDDVVIAAVERGMKLGVITESMIDQALVRQFTTMLRLGLIKGLSDNPFADTPKTRLLSTESATLARRAANEAVVLLKNDGLLPLNPAETKTLAVIGQLGNENMRDWYSGLPAYQITPLNGIRKEFPNTEIVFDDACDRVVLHHNVLSEPVASTERAGYARVTADGTITYDGDELTRTIFRVLDWGYGFAFQNEATGKYLTTTETGELKADAGEVWGWFNRPVFFLNKPNAYSQTGLTSYPTGLTGIPITDDADIQNARFSPTIPFGTPAQPFGAKREGKNQYLSTFEPGGVDKLNQTLNQLTVEVIDNGIARATKAAQKSDAALVLLGNHSLIGARECIDRPSLALPARWGALFDSVTAVNPHTILGLIAGYQYAIGRQELKAQAVIFTTHGLQEVGTAIGQTLSGANNPAGRLSQTWYPDDLQFDSLSNYDLTDSKLTYLYAGQKPLHEFGFGLSFTNFDYADLALIPENDGVSASFRVTNTGERPGDEVPQIYYVPNLPGKPNKVLVGFARITLQPGESKRVSIPIAARDLSFWDESQKQFVKAESPYQFEVGASSADTRLTGSV